MLQNNCGSDKDNIKDNDYNNNNNIQRYDKKFI